MEGKVRNLPLLPYSTMIINSLLWSSYGLLQKDPRIWSCNGLGLFLGIGYFYTFAQYAKAATNLPGTVLQHQQLCVVSAVLTLFLWSQSAVATIGHIGLVFNILLFASPLAALRVVLETRSARSIPLPFTIACIVNCYLWFVNPDPNIYTPNGIGLLLSLIQLALKLYFGDGKMPKEDGLPLRRAVSSDSSK